MEKDDKNQGKNTNQTELIQFRCTADIKNKLAKLAEKEGTDVSKFVRNAAIRLVTASERQKKTVTPNTVTTLERNEWNIKELQQIAVSILGVLGFILVFRLLARLF